jgi:bifunctional UDP-N-acetylglucosamine pyrophosphorylase/glucosamine-1-phosphate N-acetyltransferase
MTVRAIVLAAGKGTRMKSDVTKVLHELCGRPLLWYVIQALRAAGIDDVLVVTNPELQNRIDEFGVRGVLQGEQLGTGHAVQVALAAMTPSERGRIVVAYGDMPLAGPAIYRSIVDALDGDVPMTLITARMPASSNFGRIVRRGENVERIVEARDATPEELRIEEANAGIYAFHEDRLREAVSGLRNDNAQKEYYLTDTVEKFVRGGERVRPILVEDAADVAGINDRVELALARREMNARLCAAAMRDGVTIVDPDTTYLEPEVEIGRDTVIYPNTSLARLSCVGTHCVVGPNSRLSNARLGDRVTVRESVIVDSTLGDGVQVGPFAHLRANARLAGGVRIGNFVEVKNSELGDGAKANHLAYVGDASVGSGSNIGAGTITCNFDGERKNRTTIGKNVSIGSNTSLVAPVDVGDGALTGAGSVVIRDVPAGERVAGNPARPLPKKEV